MKLANVVRMISTLVIFMLGLFGLWLAGGAGASQLW
jgi:hypothetical protein